MNGEPPIDTTTRLRTENRQLRDAAQQLAVTAQLLLYLEEHGTYPGEPTQLPAHELDAATTKLRVELDAYSRYTRALTTQ